MKEANEISIILPVFNADEGFLARALESVAKQKVLPDSLIIVVKKDSDDHKLVEVLTKSHVVNTTIIAHDGDTNFQAQFNLGVKNCKTDWFIFLEQDDEVSNIWVDNVIKYRADNPDVTIFLPIVVEVKPNDAFMGFTNEPVWASQFCDELGILDNAALLRFQNFSIDGMAVLKEAYDDYGGLKESIVLSFIYEFLLRMTHNSCRVMVIPKNGYKHVNEREGALWSNYKKDLSEDEFRWWLSLAKRECFHIQDRKILYEKKE